MAPRTAESGPVLLLEDHLPLPADRGQDGQHECQGGSDQEHQRDGRRHEDGRIAPGHDQGSAEMLLEQRPKDELDYIDRLLKTY